MGTVTNVSTTNSITAAKYNELRDAVADMLDTPSGSYVDDGTAGTIQGYDHTITAQQVALGDKVTNAEWNDLITDVSLIFDHRTGANPSSPALPTLSTGDEITATRFNNIVTNHNANYNDRFTVDSSNVSIATATSGTLAANWNGNNRHVFNMTFASEDDKFLFFNTGGSLRITASASYAGAESKSIDWRNMVTNLEQVDIFAGGTTYTNSSYAGGTKLVSYQGWYFLDSKPNGTPDTEVYKFDSSVDGGTAEYNENFCRYRFRRQNDTTYVFFLDFHDVDTGDQTGTGAPVDENVQTVITTTVQVLTPTGTLSATQPTFSANGATIGFTATY